MKCALITGASSGIGRQFALHLASQLEHIILVARRKSELAGLANELLYDRPNLQVTYYVKDLSLESDRNALAESLERHQTWPDLLINNAGLGDYGDFESSDWQRNASQMRVNMEALTHLSWLCVPHMKKMRKAFIINVSSLASVIPIPDFAVYAATKAYVTSFSEALRLELKSHDINVLALCPGPVKTEFGEVAQRETHEKKGDTFRTGFYVPVDQVVVEAMKALHRNQARCYPSVKIGLMAFIFNNMPFNILRFFLGLRGRKVKTIQSEDQGTVVYNHEIASDD